MSAADKAKAAASEKFDMLDAVAADPNVSGAAFRVFYVLLQHRNGTTGECYPSLERLAQRSGVDERSVQRALSSLIEAGWIKTERPNRHHTNRYVICAGKTVPPETTVPSSHNEANGGPEPASRDDENVTPETTKTSSLETTNLVSGETTKTSPKHLRGTPKAEPLSLTHSKKQHSTATHPEAAREADALPLRGAEEKIALEERPAAPLGPQLQAAWKDSGSPHPCPPTDVVSIEPIQYLIDEGRELSDVLDTVRLKAAKGQRISSWKYIAAALKNASGPDKGILSTMFAEKPISQERLDTYRHHVARYMEGLWDSAWGAPPGTPDCQVPDHILLEYRILPWKVRERMH